MDNMQTVSAADAKQRTNFGVYGEAGKGNIGGGVGGCATVGSALGCGSKR
jgi:hypothetical protein